MTDTLSLFFALLAAIAVVLAALTAAALLTSSGPLARFGRELQPVALWLGFAIATTATLGSLYYSEIADFPPCRYCWFQRIAMYPLAPMLGIAAVTKDRAVKKYAAPLAAIGALLAMNHLRIQWFPEEGGSCSVEAPCSAQWVDVAGFVSIPMMALCGFVAILLLSLSAGRATLDLTDDGGHVRAPDQKATT